MKDEDEEVKDGDTESKQPKTRMEKRKECSLVIEQKPIQTLDPAVVTDE